MRVGRRDVESIAQCLGGRGGVDNRQAFQPYSAGCLAPCKCIHEMAYGSIRAYEVDVATWEGKGDGSRPNSTQGFEAAIDRRAKRVFAESSASPDAHGKHSPPRDPARDEEQLLAHSA